MVRAGLIDKRTTQMFYGWWLLGLSGFISSLQTAGVAALTYATTLPALVVFGLGFGERNPLAVAIQGDYFGQAEFGKILALSTVPMNIPIVGGRAVCWLDTRPPEEL